MIEDTTERLDSAFIHATARTHFLTTGGEMALDPPGAAPSDKVMVLRAR